MNLGRKNIAKYLFFLFFAAFIIGSIVSSVILVKKWTYKKETFAMILNATNQDPTHVKIDDFVGSGIILHCFYFNDAFMQAIMDQDILEQNRLANKLAFTNLDDLTYTTWLTDTEEPYNQTYYNFEEDNELFTFSTQLIPYADNSWLLVDSQAPVISFKQPGTYHMRLKYQNLKQTPIWLKFEHGIPVEYEYWSYQDITFNIR